MTEPARAKAVILLNGKPLDEPHTTVHAAHMATVALGPLPGGQRPVQPLPDGAWLVEISDEEAAELAAEGELVRADGPGYRAPDPGGGGLASGAHAVTVQPSRLHSSPRTGSQ